MNTGQSMLAIGAMILLSTLILRVNNGLLSSKEVMYESKFGVLATSLATSIIEEASNKAFDEKTDGNPVIYTSALTPYDSLGKDLDEEYDDFDDFDDYNGFSKHVANLPSAEFDIYCTVGYINPPNLETIVATQTWHKKITVYVTSPSTSDTVKLSTIYSYWFFQ